MSGRSLARILHSRDRLPGHWLISRDDYVLPSSYVRKDYVERLLDAQ